MCVYIYIVTASRAVLKTFCERHAARPGQSLTQRDSPWHARKSAFVQPKNKIPVSVCVCVSVTV